MSQLWNSGEDKIDEEEKQNEKKEKTKTIHKKITEE